MVSTKRRRERGDSCGRLWPTDGAKANWVLASTLGDPCREFERPLPLLASRSHTASEPLTGRGGPDRENVGGGSVVRKK